MPARFALRAIRAQSKAVLVASLVLLPLTAWSATPPNTPVTNTATASYQIAGTPISTSGSVTVTTAARTPATIEFLQYAAAGGGSAVQVNATQCNGGPLPSPNYPFPPAATLTVPGAINLAPATVYRKGEPVFIRVTDFDHNVNAAAIDTITVTVTAPTGDSETLTLSETGISTGVFVGYLMSTAAPAAVGNCQLSVASNQIITSSYTDPLDATTTVSANALVDPFGTVIDSATGLPVNGASVTIIDIATGLPATVLCDDLTTVLPQPVTSGSPTVCDAVITPGGFRFPLVPPGNYRLVITPPAGYVAPSTVPGASIPGSHSIVGAPGSGASYGGSFTLTPGPAVVIDLPMDAGGGELQITKTAAKTSVGIGEYVPYMLVINNTGSAPSAGVHIVDYLPRGFRYQPGSARRDGVVLADPVISADGRTLTFDLGSIPGSASVTLKYVAVVTAGAPTGKAENIAAAAGGISNTARASVNVVEDLMRSRAILEGRVSFDACDARGDDRNGLANARIVLEDGTYILTDEHGRWHAENIRPGTHVVQLDLESLPADVELETCGGNSRSADKGHAQFVNLRGGSLWRVDFHLRKKVADAGKVSQQLRATRDAGQVALQLQLKGDAAIANASATLMLPAQAHLVAGSVRLNGSAIDAEESDGVLVLRLPAQNAGWTAQLQATITAPENAPAKISSVVRVLGADKAATSIPAVTADADARTDAVEASAPMLVAASTTVAAAAVDDGHQNLVEQLPYDKDWLAAATPGAEWLHPQASFKPALPAIKIAIKHAPTDTVSVRVNGEKVSALNYDGAQSNAAGTVSLSLWRGVPVKEGDNTLDVSVVDASGKEVLRQTRHISYSTDIASAVFVPELSRLVADGKTRPVIAMRFLDKNGQPARRGMSGEFDINSPYQSANQLDAIRRDPLGGKVGDHARFEIGQDGVALIELAPTTQSGEAILKFNFNERRDVQEVRAWLVPGQRDWILVGFAEGVIGAKNISGNHDAFASTGDDEQLFDGNRVAFYAKGTIKGDTLLTIAYDSAKRRGDGGATLGQAIDPNRYYTLYGDSTQPYFDAASQRKLYLKIERKQFYALFGDFDTGLTVTEFSRYSRTVNGLKSEYRGEKFGYNAFATMTAQAYVKDEIPGDGTSGLYRLSRRDIVEGSDKIRIETRDRFQSQNILKTQVLTRYLDYDIDVLNGTLFFKSPVLTRDVDFNPIYIVAEYEAGDSRHETLTWGGRANFRPTENVEIGATMIHEGTKGATGNLHGLDAIVQLDDKTKLVAEYAQSNRHDATERLEGDAWKVELTRHDEKLDAKAYIRQQDAGFGLGQQAGGESGTRKMGVEARARISDDLTLQGQVYRQQLLGSDVQRDVAEIRADQKFDKLTGYYGARYARDTDGSGDARTTEQLLAGLAYEMPNKKITLRAGAEIGVGAQNDNTGFPDRLTLGVDYALSDRTTLLAEQEFARGDKLQTSMTRLGLRTRPWKGGEVEASLGDQSSLDGGRVFANLGLVQRWEINQHWRTDIAIDRSQTLSGTAVPFSTNLAPTSGSVEGDYTAVSAGLNYNNQAWSANARIEKRVSDIGDKLDFLLGAQRTLDDGRVLAAGLLYLDTSNDTGQSHKLDARFSYASRQSASAWTWLNRFDYIDESSQDAIGNLKARKLVNNTNLNWMPGLHTQVALQYGAKYVFDSIDGSDYSGYTDLMGLEVRHDLGARWDVGAHASMLHSWGPGVRNFGVGASLGYKLGGNTWLAVGYNFLGFDDADFSGAESRVKGAYLAIRIRFDQDLLKFDQHTSQPVRSKP